MIAFGESLANEILYSIIINLSISDVSHLAQTCKFFYKYVFSPSFSPSSSPSPLWIDLLLRDFPFNTTEAPPSSSSSSLSSSHSIYLNPLSTKNTNDTYNIYKLCWGMCIAYGIGMKLRIRNSHNINVGVYLPPP